MINHIGFHSTTVITNDFDNDNYLDIILTSLENDTISVFLGYGNGSFQS